MIMHRLKNYQRTSCGIRRRLYTVIKKQKSNKYYYYLNLFIRIDESVGDFMVFKSANKPFLLNKITLPIIGVIYNLFFFLIQVPAFLVYKPVFMYFDGAIRFVKDTAWVRNVRYFNYANIVIIILLIILLIFK